jgi:hypothetical protein
MVARFGCWQLFVTAAQKEGGTVYYHGHEALTATATKDPSTHTEDTIEHLEIEKKKVSREDRKEAQSKKNVLRREKKNRKFKFIITLN